MRSFTMPLLALLIVGGFCSTASADAKIDAETKEKIDKALEWLAKQQNEDGSWSDRQFSHNTAVTAFALLAFMSQGNLPNQGLYAPEVSKAARFLMASGITPRGVPKELEKSYLVGARGGTGHNGGRMYSHGMATLALAQLWGSTGDDTIKPVLKKAVDLIVRSQNRRGGWRYDPTNSNADDISVTIMQVMALRAAKNAGIHFPNEVFDKAIKYIESCYNKREGGFSYQPGGRGPGFARTAAGACVLFLTGKYNAKQIPKAVDYLEDKFDSRSHFFYGHYYAAHAMHQVGGRRWEKWYKRISDFLFDCDPDGRKSGRYYYNPEDSAWNGRVDGSSAGPVYQTSIAVIILSVPAHYLPIFQR